MIKGRVEDFLTTSRSMVACVPTAKDAAARYVAPFPG
jgi:hypothetical protein